MLIFNIQLQLISLSVCNPINFISSEVNKTLNVDIPKPGNFELEGVGGDQHVVGVSYIPFTSALHFLQRGLQHERTTQTSRVIARDY